MKRGVNPVYAGRGGRGEHVYRHRLTGRATHSPRASRPALVWRLRACHQILGGAGVRLCVAVRATLSHTKTPDDATARRHASLLASAGDAVRVRPASPPTLSDPPLPSPAVAGGCIHGGRPGPMAVREGGADSSPPALDVPSSTAASLRALPGAALGGSAAAAGAWSAEGGSGGPIGVAASASPPGRPAGGREGPMAALRLEAPCGSAGPATGPTRPRFRRWADVPAFAARCCAYSRSRRCSCRKNPALGAAWGRLRFTVPSASSSDSPRAFIRYATTIATERLTPLLQCTSTPPAPRGQGARGLRRR